MKRENRRNILFRYCVIVILITLLSFWICYNLWDTTYRSADIWNRKADSTLAKVDTILPVRGSILACDGSLLSANMILYNARVDFRTPKFDEKYYRAAIDSLADTLAFYHPVRNRQQWKEYLEKPLSAAPNKRTRGFMLLKGLSYEQWLGIRKYPFFKAKISKTGLHKEEKPVRARPYGAMARRSIGGVSVGITSADSQYFAKHGKFGRNHKIPYGVYGLERSLDSLLKGREGYSRKVPLTNAIVNWTDVAPIDGYDVTTTIDIKMQDIVETELNKVLDVCKADWGTAILMEVGTGDIKAIANLERNPKTGETYIESLNYAVRRADPGSVVKLLSLLVMMEDGKIPNINKVYSTGPSFGVGNTRVTDCTKTESLPVSRALEISSNIVISKLILEAYGNNPGKFYSRIKEIGFLDRFNTGIAEEVRPWIDSLNSRQRVALTRQAFGYATDISPLYICALYNAVAGGGQFVRPRLVKGLHGNGIDSILPVTYVRDRICSEKTAADLRSMLRKVVWGERGTARKVVRSDKVEIAGKTGTANMIQHGQYVKGVSRLSFCGFFPYDKPQYTCMVVVAYPRETWRSPETTSGRVVKNVAEAMLARGMLGNTSDYRTTEPKGNPVYYAEADNVTTTLHQQMGGSNRSIMRAPQNVSSGVPDVTGLGVRDAIKRLEEAGYNVEISGSGYVESQSPLPGSNISLGTKVKLRLKE